ncbi:hypothetical protein [Lactococcus cremoris]|uniref:hypothetical protein n=1 Tax=Lactococcus lactis subsp. cremoris TaxID=1359 RepID=UPI002909FCC8|nr:hypothetical protein [Lactococcus cremoris]MDU8930551.1 hypothetical protein [Lactococcus cremoris]
MPLLELTNLAAERQERRERLAGVMGYRVGDESRSVTRKVAESVKLGRRIDELTLTDKFYQIANEVNTFAIPTLSLKWL